MRHVTTIHFVALLALAACSGGGGGGGGPTGPPTGPPTTPPPAPVVGTISGSVVNAEGGPVAGATVTTEPATGTATTDAAGSYRIEGITLSGSLAPAATYTVRVSRAGFNVASTTVNLTAASPQATAPAVTMFASLRAAALLRNTVVGTAVGSGALQFDVSFREVVGREFNSLTPENDMKWEVIHPGRNQYSFTAADAIVTYAEQNGMRVHGHVLLWEQQLPQWLTQGTFTRDEYIAILRDHIMTVVGRYRGRVASWDVANEMIAFDNSGVRQTDFWVQRIGPEVIEMAFRWAREADPAAKLYINDFGTEFPGPRVDALRVLVQDLQARGVPVDGVGFQAHVDGNAPFTGNELRTVLMQFSALGLETRVTELDVRLAAPASAADFERQAQIYRDLTSAALTVPRFAGVTVWGFTDRYSWVPFFFQGFGAATLLDENLVKKPAYFAVRQSLTP